MAIKLIYDTIVIPIAVVLSKYTLEEWECMNDKGVGWDDGYLYAQATMDPSTTDEIMRKWEKLGFAGKSIVNGEECWTDFCLPETSTKCHWLSYTEYGVYLKNAEPGELVAYNSKERGAAPTKEKNQLNPVHVSIQVFIILALLSFLFLYLFVKI